MTSSDLIDFLDTGHLDLKKWRTIRRGFEAAWPELAKMAYQRW